MFSACSNGNNFQKTPFVNFTEIRATLQIAEPFDIVDGRKPITIKFKGQGWSAPGPVPGQYDIEFSNNGGINYQKILSHPFNPGDESKDVSVEWNPGGIEIDSQAKIRVSLVNKDNTYAVWGESALFSIDSNPPIVENLTAPAQSVYPITKMSVGVKDVTPKERMGYCFLPCKSKPEAPSADNLCFKSYKDELEVLLGFVEFTYHRCVWVKDLFGRVSSLGNAGLGSAGVDKALVKYIPENAPIVTNVTATRADKNQGDVILPIDATQTTAPVGKEIIVRYHVTDDKELASKPIVITQNDTVLASGLDNGVGYGCQVASPRNDLPGKPFSTGCFKFVNQVAGASTVRVSAADHIGMVSRTSAPSLNAGEIRVLAGNTDAGLNTSARAAVFFSRKQPIWNDSGFFVVLENGLLLMRDHRGIILTNFMDGVVRLLIPQGVSGDEKASDVDGGISLSQAKVYRPHKISADHRDNVYIWDNDRIRKINLSALKLRYDGSLNLDEIKVTRVVGGGTSKASGTMGADYKIDPIPSNIDSYPLLNSKVGQFPFFVMKNGDIVFQAEHYFEAGNLPSEPLALSIFRAATGKVERLAMTGKGHADCPGGCSAATLQGPPCEQENEVIGIRALNSPAISYDSNSKILDVVAGVFHLVNGGAINPLTRFQPSADGKSLVTVEKAKFPPPFISAGKDAYSKYSTQMDGKIYAFSTDGAVISRYESSSNTWTQLVGNGVVGRCEDGTLALSCAIDVQDVFVSIAGQLYFADRGVIRTLTEDGLVTTVAGQARNFGDKGFAFAARFYEVNNIDFMSNGNVVALDRVEARFRTFQPDGAIDTVAGNGTPTIAKTDVLATQTTLGVSSAGRLWTHFSVMGDEIYFTRGSRVAKLNKSTKKWQDVLGYQNGGVLYWENTANGQVGSLIKNDGYYPQVMGSNNGSLMVSKWGYNRDAGKYENGMFKLYNSADSFRQRSLAGMPGLILSNNICGDGTLLSNCTIQGGEPTNYSRPHFDAATGGWIMVANAQTSDDRRALKLLRENGAMATFSRKLDRIPESFVLHRPASGQALVYYCAAGRLYKHVVDSAAGTDVAMPWAVGELSCSGISMHYKVNATTGKASLYFPAVREGLSSVIEYVLP